MRGVFSIPGVGLFRSGCFALLLGLLLPMSALAQHSNYNRPSDLPPGQIAQIEDNRRKAFARMQANPADLQSAFAYAMLSNRVGDLEAAASTYEAMLVRKPDAARVRLELAATYYRLGAMELAQRNFRVVRAQQGTPVPVRQRIDAYLALIDRRTQGQSGFSGRVSMGLRYNDNANSAPSSDLVTLNDLEWLLDEDARDQSDVSVNLSAQLRHRFLWGGGGHAFETGLNLGLAEYDKLDELSNHSVELRFGPDFALDDLGIKDGRLGVGLSLGQSWLGGEKYMIARGVQLNFRKNIDRKSRLNAVLDWRDENYAQNNARPTGNDYDGHRLQMQLGYSTQIKRDWQVFAGLSYVIRKAEVSRNAYREAGLRLGAARRIASPISKLKDPWVLSVVGNIERRKNDAPDPLVDRNNAQRGTEYGLQFVQSIPLRKNVDLRIFEGVRRVSSNYDTRDYTDSYVGFTISRDF